MISVLIPTRERPELLRESIESLVLTADDPNDVEFVIRRDSDDKSDYGHLERTTTILGPPKGYTGLAHYYETCVRYAVGKWLLIWNDDAIMRTKGWDTQIRRASSDAWAVLGASCFPVMSQKWFRTVGACPTAHVDSYIWQIVDLLGHQWALKHIVSPSEPWDVHHRADELDDAGSERRRQEILGPEGTSAFFFTEPVRLAARRDADLILAATAPRTIEQSL